MKTKSIAIYASVATAAVMSLGSAALAGNYDSPEEHYNNYVYETAEEHYDHVVYETPEEHYDHVNYNSPEDTYNSKVW
jgi:hypothetical protein